LKNLYSSKLENLEEMNNFLDLYYLPKLTQKNNNHLNRCIGAMSLKRKTPGPDVFTVKFYQTIKEELTSVLLKLFHEIEREGMLPVLLPILH
jgi:hypothetical protein